MKAGEAAAKRMEKAKEGLDAFCPLVAKVCMGMTCIFFRMPEIINSAAPKKWPDYEVGVCDCYLRRKITENEIDT